jgi:hypothetical protein
MDFAINYISSVPSISLYASTFVFGLSFGLIKYSEYIQGMCISNTKLISRQNDQILFILKRTVELNKKIDRLQLEFSALSETNSSFTEDVVDEEKEEKEEIKEEVFELIETTMNSTTSNKKSGWLSFLF